MVLLQELGSERPFCVTRSSGHRDVTMAGSCGSSGRLGQRTRGGLIYLVPGTGTMTQRDDLLPLGSMASSTGTLHYGRFTTAANAEQKRQKCPSQSMSMYGRANKDFLFAPCVFSKFWTFVNKVCLLYASRILKLKFFMS